MTDVNVIAIAVNPNNPNEDITYNIAGGTYRVIDTPTTLHDLEARGIQHNGITANLFSGLAQERGWGQA